MSMRAWPSFNSTSAWSEAPVGPRPVGVKGTSTLRLSGYWMMLRGSSAAADEVAAATSEASPKIERERLLFAMGTPFRRTHERSLELYYRSLVLFMPEREVANGFDGSCAPREQVQRPESSSAVST